LSNLESGSFATISNLFYYISAYIYTKIGACISICKIFQLTTWTNGRGPNSTIWSRWSVITHQFMTKACSTLAFINPDLLTLTQNNLKLNA